MITDGTMAVANEDWLTFSHTPTLEMLIHLKMAISPKNFSIVFINVKIQRVYEWIIIGPIWDEIYISVWNQFLVSFVKGPDIRLEKSLFGLYQTQVSYNCRACYTCTSLCTIFYSHCTTSDLFLLAPGFSFNKAIIRCKIEIIYDGALVLNILLVVVVIFSAPWQIGPTSIMYLETTANARITP